MDTASDQKKDLEEILQTYQRNLQRIEKRIALHGGEMNAPTYLVNERDDTRANMKRLEKEIADLEATSKTHHKLSGLMGGIATAGLALDGMLTSHNPPPMDYINREPAQVQPYESQSRIAIPFSATINNYQIAHRQGELEFSFDFRISQSCDGVATIVITPQFRLPSGMGLWQQNTAQSFSYSDPQNIGSIVFVFPYFIFPAMGQYNASVDLLSTQRRIASAQKSFSVDLVR